MALLSDNDRHSVSHFSVSRERLRRLNLREQLLCLLHVARYVVVGRVLELLLVVIQLRQQLPVLSYQDGFITHFIVGVLLHLLVQL